MQSRKSFVFGKSYPFDGSASCNVHTRWLSTPSYFLDWHISSLKCATLHLVLCSWHHAQKLLAILYDILHSSLQKLLKSWQQLLTIPIVIPDGWPHLRSILWWLYSLSWAEINQMPLISCCFQWEVKRIWTALVVKRNLSLDWRTSYQSKPSQMTCMTMADTPPHRQEWTDIPMVIAQSVRNVTGESL